MAKFHAEFSSGQEFNAEFGSVQPVAAAEHNELPGRDEEDAHPITAITGLEERLSEIEKGTVTDKERESWNNKSRVYRNASGSLVIAV